MVLPSPVRVIAPIVRQPELVGVRLDINTGDDAKTFARSFGVTAPLAAHQLDGKGVVFIQHRIIKDQIGLRGRHDLRPHLVPDQAGREPFRPQVPIDFIVTERLTMIGQVRHRVIDLTDQQILTVSQASDTSFQAADFSSFSMIARLSRRCCVSPE